MAPKVLTKQTIGTKLLLLSISALMFSSFQAKSTESLTYSLSSLSRADAEKYAKKVDSSIESYCQSIIQQLSKGASLVKEFIKNGRRNISQKDTHATQTITLQVAPEKCVESLEHVYRQCLLGGHSKKECDEIVREAAKTMLGDGGTTANTTLILVQQLSKISSLTQRQTFLKIVQKGVEGANYGEKFVEGITNWWNKPW